MSQPKMQLKELLELYGSSQELLRHLSLALIEERLAEDEVGAVEETEPGAEHPPYLVIPRSA